ncbi:MAG: hypothetical protein KDC26_10845 [Armatimonadetes bacterium]|nr:hypothetical protein [Armatimonadota bacterium]
MLIAALIALPQKSFTDFVLDGMAYRQWAEHDEVIIATETRTDGKKVVYELNLSRPNVTSIKVTGVPEIPASRTMVIEPESFTIFDTKLRQYERHVMPDLSLAEVIGQYAPQIDPFVAGLINEGGLEEWLETIRDHGEFKLKNVPSGYAIRFESPRTSAELFITAGRPKLAGITMKAEGLDSRWTLNYRPLKSKFALPGDAYEVAKIDPTKSLPKGSPQAKNLLTTVIATYERPSAMNYAVKEDGQEIKVWYRSDFVAQESDGVFWSFDGTRLSIRDKDGAVYTGKASGTLVVETVAKAGTRVEPMLRSWVLGENPLARLVTGDGNAKATGDKQWQGKTWDTITAETSQLRVTLFVDKNSHFVGRVLSEPKDESGKVIIQRERVFRELKGNEAKPSVDLASASRTKPLDDLR